MKIIHCADIHLGSKMDTRLPREKAEERRKELRAAFSGLVAHAAKLGVRVILISGDLFDSDRPAKKDKEFFYNVVKASPDIDFIYLRGNHDGLESYTEGLENLKTFSAEWSQYTYGDVTIAGIELCPANALSLYSTLRLPREGYNIVMLHGQAGDGGKDGIVLRKLRDKNIDYLALGHVHAHGGFNKLDERGVWAYSGCLEGRGFDETGEKGFILLDTDLKTAAFAPCSLRVIKEYDVDISAASDDFSSTRAVMGAVDCEKKDIVRVNLTGEITFDNEGLAQEIEKRLQRENYYCVSVKDRTERKIDYSAFENDLSLRGEFVRQVLADGGLDEERKKKIIAAGLRALEGREAEV